MSGARRLVTLGFVAGVGLPVALVAVGGGTSPAPRWRAGVAVSQPLPVGSHVVEERVPVAVVPDVTGWTGSQLLTFGVRGDRNVGAAYEPATGRWRALPTAPFGVAVRGVVGVFTGDGWVVVGVLCDRLARQADGRDGCVPGRLAAAVYDPVHDLWWPVHATPVPAGWGFGPGHPATVGRAVGRLDGAAVFAIDGHYYSVRARAGTWTGLPDPPRLDRRGSDGDIGVCALDAAMVATAAVRRHDEEPRALGTVNVAVLAPGARTWDDAGAVAPPPGATTVATACTRSGVLVYAPDLSWVAQWDLRARAWEEVTPAALPEGAGAYVGTEAGRRVVFSRPGTAVSYDPRLRMWRPLPPGLPPDPARVVWIAPGAGLAFEGRALVAYHTGG